MKQVKYRFNRKEGKVYIDRNGVLEEQGDSLRMVILNASEPVFGKLFAHMPAQKWVLLTFLNEAGDWCYAVLADGTTGGLFNWLLYRQLIEESKGLNLYEVITTIAFEPIDSSDRQYFDYTFSGIAGKPGLGDRMQALIGQSEHPLTEPISLIH